ncbi:MAG: ABC transporter ATP-binding protein [Candidatus Latescibacteria bacterium]|nr:ABC transporter ATP-binding protein [Candidatus Latescibacterota bacterium]
MSASPDSVLITRNVTKVFQAGDDDVPVLTDVTLDINRAEFLIVMGPSGCGKSTLLHLLSGLDKPTSGEILVDGLEITSLSRRQMTLMRRENIGFIFQFFNLLPHLTVRENIAMPTMISGGDPKLRESYLDGLMDWIGITHRAGHFPAQLSGGEMQRVSIARALSNEPAIVLADEPTGNVSSRVGEDVMKLLRECTDKRGQTVLLVTHNARDAAHGDRVLFLKDGMIRPDHTLTGPDVNEGRIFTCLQELGI